MKTRMTFVLLAAALTTSAAWAQPAVHHSGFLGDYSTLAAEPDRSGTQLFLDKSGDYRGYTKLLFEPVEVVLEPNPEYKGVRPDVLKHMTDSFSSAFKNAIAADYQIVTTPGPDVLRVRLAITGVQAAPPDTSVTDFLPIVALFNVARAVTEGAPRVAEMTGEMEVLDAGGKRVAAAIATRKGEQKLAQGAQVTWKDINPIVQYWAKGFRRLLDEVRGIPAN